MTRHTQPESTPRHTRLDEQSESWNIKPYLLFVWRWLWLIGLFAFFAGATAYAVRTMEYRQAQQEAATLPTAAPTLTPIPSPTPLPTPTPSYKTSARLILTSTPIPDINAQGYARLLRSPLVLETVIDNLRLDTTPAELAARIETGIASETQFIYLDVTDISAQRAEEIANEIVRVFIAQQQTQQVDNYVEGQQNQQRQQALLQAEIDRLVDQASALQNSTAITAEIAREQLQIALEHYTIAYADLRLKLLSQQETSVPDNLLQIVEKRTGLITWTAVPQATAPPSPPAPPPAAPPEPPAPPDPWPSTILAAIIGAMVAGSGAYIVEVLDQSIKSSTQVEQLTGQTVLAVVDHIQTSTADNAELVIMAANTPLPQAEAYRMLPVNIGFSALQRPCQTIAVTSSGQQEGKSITVANLATALAQMGQRVIAVDANLRQPMLHTFFGKPNEPGIAALLQTAANEPIDTYLLPTSQEHLLLLPAGSLPANPTGLLGSQRFATLLDTLKSQADVIIFDTYALLPVADTTLLTRLCDATILVVRAGVTQADTLRQASDHCTYTDIHLVGTVLNDASPRRRGV